MPEVWLQGAIKNIPALLQPVAHALLQAREEVHSIMHNFPEKKLWEKPAGVASVGFHLLHLTGVLDRLFTYARNESISNEQLKYLESEKQPSGISIKQLLEAFDAQINLALKQLSETDESTLTNYRSVGRKKLPSTIMGLLFHSAEHTMRHTGQLLVTAKFLPV
jgi:uncharacterized damage-inducible protein DinB